MEVGTYVSVGDRYADKMHYTDYVNSEGILTESLTAINYITILTSANTSLIGKEVTIHTEDTIVCHAEAAPQRSLYAILNQQKQQLILSRYESLFHFYIETMSRKERARLVRLVKPRDHADEVIDHVEEGYPGLSFSIVFLDRLDTDESCFVFDRFMKACPEEAGYVAKALGYHPEEEKQPKEDSSLTIALREQVVNQQVDQLFHKLQHYVEHPEDY